MTKFQYNIAKAKEINDEIEMQLKEYKNNMDNYYLLVKSASNYWHDPISDNFYKEVQNDELCYNDIMDNLMTYQKNVNRFTNGLSNIFFNHNYPVANLNISYNSAYISGILIKLGSVNNTLQSAINQMNSAFCPYDFPYRYMINSVNTELVSIKNKISNLKSDLGNTNQNISDLISTLKESDASISTIETDQKITSFEWVPSTDKINSFPTYKINLSSMLSQIDSDLNNIIHQTNQDNNQ